MPRRRLFVLVGGLLFFCAV